MKLFCMLHTVYPVFQDDRAGISRGPGLQTLSPGEPHDWLLRCINRGDTVTRNQTPRFQFISSSRSSNPVILRNLYRKTRYRYLNDLSES